MLDTVSAFSVPPGLQLPAELEGSPPRDLTDAVRNGPLAQKKRRAYWGYLAAAGVCWLLSEMPFVETLALYLLPLGYLNWIALGLAMIAFATWLGLGKYRKAIRFVREGESSFGRVLEIVKCPSAAVSGQTTAYAFQVAFDTLHPNSDQPTVIQVKSHDFSLNQKDRVETRFRVGDYVPIVWLPNRFDKTVQIYDFLELTDEASLNRNVPIEPKPLWRSIFGPVFAVLFIFALFWTFYAYGRYQPLDFDIVRSGWIPFAIGGVVGVTFAAVAWLTHQRRRAQTERLNAEAQSKGNAVELEVSRGMVGQFLFSLVIVFSAILLGGVTFLCWAFTANAILDNSEPKEVDVQITNLIQTTYSGLVRVYKLQYRRDGDRTDNDLLSTPEHMSKFEAPLGIAKVRSGYFGWPWVDTIEPANHVAPQGQ